MKCPISNRSNAIFGSVVGYFFGDGDITIIMVTTISYLGCFGFIVEIVVDAVDFGLGKCDCCGDVGNEEE